MLKSNSIFASIIGQTQPLRILTTLYQKQTLPHAFLFTGIDGIGKKKAAIAFAMLCNCINKEQLKEKNSHTNNKTVPCGKCVSCNKIISGNHPDIILIEPSGSFIKIIQIRDLSSTLTMKPFEAKLRIVIISDAQTMSTEAGNALLKNLEEPPDKTIFILTALQVSDLLPTIVSRCHNIRFNPVKVQHISDILVNHHGINKDNAMLFANMADGSIGKAVSMSKGHKQFDWIKHKRWLLHIVFENIRENLSTSLLLIIAAKLSKNKEIILDSLEMIISFLKDFVVYQYCPENIIDKDVRYHIQHISEKIPVESVVKKIKAIQSAQKNIRSNANINIRLTLEALVLKLAGI